MEGFVENLLKIDAESRWSSEDILSTDGEVRVFRRYLESVLSLLIECMPQITHAYVAVSGIRCRFFTPVAAVGRSLDKIAVCPTIRGRRTTLIAAELEANSNKSVIRLVEPSHRSNFVGDSRVKDKLVIRLNYYGEFFGFISLDSYHENVFSLSVVDTVEERQALLSRIIADAVFSMRLKKLSAPLHFASADIDQTLLYDEIAEQAALGFAADGAVLRLWDSERDDLGVVSRVPPDSDDADLIEDSVREAICRKVYNSDFHGFTAQSLEGDGEADANGFGEEITSKETELLRELGIHSYMIMTLKSDLELKECVKKIGTISIFHSRPHRFSWRDIALFKAFCQRVADTLLLIESNDKLGERNGILQATSSTLTSVELVALIAHDLYHKTFNVNKSVVDYVSRCRVAMNNRAEARTHEHLEEYAETAIQSAISLQKTLDQLRLVQNRGDEALEDITEFLLRDMINDIEDTVGGALRRAKLTVHKDIPPRFTIHGRRTVLLGALYNLVINSIEAAFTRDRPKAGGLFIHSHYEFVGSKKRAVITVRDDGPGINRQRFKNPYDIFKIGETSKTKGTGCGLPVSRNLLSVHLDAQLTLQEPDRTLFRIVIPQ